MLHWLYLYFPQLQLDTQFAMSSTEVIALANHQGNLVQLSTAAKKKGLTQGQGLGQASLLVSGLAVYPYQEEVEVAELKRIASVLYNYTADICMMPPKGLLIACDGMQSLYNNSEQYWHVLETQLKTLGVQYYFASGSSPLLAKALAQAGTNVIFTNQQNARNQLALLSLQFADITTKEIALLTRVGITHFKQLLGVSLDELAKRYSRELVMYVGKLTGQYPHRVTFYIPDTHFEKQLTLHYEVSLTKHLEKPLLLVLKQQQAFLLATCKLAKQVTLILHFREVANLVFELSSAHAEYRAEHWLTLFLLRLENTELPAPVIALTIKSDYLVSNLGEEGDLFSQHKSGFDTAILTAILQAKLGQEQVKTLTIYNDLRPEIASQENTFNTLSNVPQMKLIRPSFMLRSPVELTQPITISHGPERIVTGWWDNNNVARDYFIARDESGRWLWVFRTPKKQWFIHGFFS